jgi:hypothetical protein
VSPFAAPLAGSTFPRLVALKLICQICAPSLRVRDLLDDATTPDEAAFMMNPHYLNQLEQLAHGNQERIGELALEAVRSHRELEVDNSRMHLIVDEIAKNPSAVPPNVCEAFEKYTGRR